MKLNYFHQAIFKIIIKLNQSLRCLNKKRKYQKKTFNKLWVLMRNYKLIQIGYKSYNVIDV